MGVFHDIYIYRYKCYKLWPTAVNVERCQIFSSRLRFLRSKYLSIYQWSILLLFIILAASL